ncbi:E3 ubiquitin-protein ligase TRIM39-like isoform X2 [Heteronotia binoei]|uniref:E3 ubiquitin-protein ligase TRIM39-like isoform X2 n=1 Tax=Heteronotia binoei TaxID=13085 RepID=UPI00292DB304|nr:E3 ubiquitin-protein ligase TRIM39-like isoform X2 [Heteronotia binoei]
MAAVNPARALEDELFCSICLDYFTEPVILNCEHNFCRACITRTWEGLGDSFPCPQCRKRSRKGKLRPNTQLGKVAERAKELASVMGSASEAASKPSSKPEDSAREMCKKHLEALKLFCLDDQALICVVCDRSQEHRLHQIVPVEEAAQECKAQLLHHLTVLKNENDNRELLAQNKGKRLEMLLGRAEAERERTAHMFQKLQRILQDRENHMLWGLAKVTSDLTKMQQENDSRVQRGAPLLRGLIAELEQKCQQSDTELLKDIGRLLSRCKNWTFPKWVPVSTTELEERISYFSRKKAALWEDMTETREILTLDSDSAHPSLAISTDRKTVSRRCSCPAFCNDSRRFYPSFCVLGSEGFTSGRHHWLVDVKGHCGWALGVAKESMDRKKPMVLHPERGVWAVELGPYKLLPAAPVPETERDTPTRRLLVTLDYDAGRVTFSDFPNPEPLFTFRTCFTEKLFPFFWLWSPEASIKLCP